MQEVECSAMLGNPAVLRFIPLILLLSTLLQMLLALALFLCYPINFQNLLLSVSALFRLPEKKLFCNKQWSKMLAFINCHYKLVTFLLDYILFASIITSKIALYRSRLFDSTSKTIMLEYQIMLFKHGCLCEFQYLMVLLYLLQRPSNISKNIIGML